MGKLHELQQMDIDSSKKYQEYKYKEVKKLTALMIKLSIALCLCAGALCFMLKHKETIYFILMCLITAVVSLVCAAFYKRRMKALQKEPESPYEYAVVEIDDQKKVKFERGDGKQYRYRFDEKKWEDFKMEDKVLFVYIPQNGDIFAEKMEVWEKISR